MAATDTNQLTIEVAYAQDGGRVHVVTLTVPHGTTIRQAIERSDILVICPDIDLNRNAVGIFSEIRELDTPVYGHCRVEIYRPLITDPKTARRRRAGAGKN
jgi:hypothetical protein